MPKKIRVKGHYRKNSDGSISHVKSYVRRSSSDESLIGRNELIILKSMEYKTDSLVGIESDVDHLLNNYEFDRSFKKLYNFGLVEQPDPDSGEGFFMDWRLSKKGKEILKKSN